MLKKDRTLEPKETLILVVDQLQMCSKTDCKKKNMNKRKLLGTNMLTQIHAILCLVVCIYGNYVMVTLLYELC